MKKNVLVMAFAMVSAMASAQFTIWEDDFTGGNAEGWTLLDADANNSNWVARKTIALTEAGTIGDGQSDILGSYHIDMATGSPLPGADEENWAITPVQDLSFYAAPISAVINVQPAIYAPNAEMYVYIASSPELDAFLAAEPVKLDMHRENMFEGEEFEDYTVDISAYAGYSTVYIALVTREMSTGIEVKNMKINAVNLGLGDVEKKIFALKQNPVQDYLEIQATDLTNEASMAIYTVNGALVKQTAFNEEGVYVGNMPAGVYFVVLTDGKSTERLKFIKK